MSTTELINNDCETLEYPEVSDSWVSRCDVIEKTTEVSYIKVRKYGLWGILKYFDDKFHIVVSPSFEELSDFDEDGYASAKIGYDTKFKVHRSGRIAIDSSFLVSRQYKEIEGLREVDIPDHVWLDKNTYGIFEDCKNLKTVHITNCEKHKCISKGMFTGCESLEHVEIPDSVTAVCSGAFCNCKSLAHIDLSPNLETIGDGAFTGCDSMETITIPASVTKIESGGGLILCKNLKEIVVDPANQQYASIDGVLYDKSVEELVAYSMNREAKAFSVPNTIHAIYGHTFRECEHLEKVVIPASVNRIDRYAFYNCMKLKEIEVSPSNNVFSSLDGVLYDKAGEHLLLYPINKEAKEFVVPDTIHKLESNTFNMNDHLEKVVIPDSVTSFAESVFYCCDGLKEVVMPDNIQYAVGEIFFLHNDMLKNLSIVISRKLYENIQSCLPRGVKIVFKD
ncbi:MAG: leucine-rich repeat protein [Bacteroidales bacterium]|nr:leucine-rich repeat protein [Bacteroidales bacterium]